MKAKDTSSVNAVLAIIGVVWLAYTFMPERGSTNTYQDKNASNALGQNPELAPESRPADTSLSEEARSRGITEENMMCIQKAAAYETAASSRDQDDPKFIARMSLDGIRYLTARHINYIVNLVYNDPQFASIRGQNLRLIMFARCLDGEDIAPD